jgi:uncharacterized protein YndB with AHSA1/START domain
MIIKILIGLVILLAILAVIIATRSDEFNVGRSITINAPASDVFATVNDLHKWEEWSPWSKLDPNIKQAYEGPPSGVGASYTWEGNSQVGAGRSTVIESRSDELIRFRLDFEKPFKGTNTAEFTFVPNGNQTVVTWSMSGRKNFVMKAVGLFMNCDKMCGDQFNTGLANLKALVEKTPQTVLK